jgi:hypothetical protein
MSEVKDAPAVQSTHWKSMTPCSCGREFPTDGYCQCGSAHGICPRDGVCVSRLEPDGCDGCDKLPS